MNAKGYFGAVNRAGGWQKRTPHLFVLCLLTALTVVLATSAPASAAETSRAGWQALTATFPGPLQPGATGTIALTVANVGSADTSGPITVTDTLPSGLTATDAGDLEFPELLGGIKRPVVNHGFGLWECGIDSSGIGAEHGSVVTCHSTEAFPGIPGGAGIEHEQIAIEVAVAPNTVVGQLPNQVEIANQGTETAVVADYVNVSPPSSDSGLAHWKGWFSNRDGSLDTRAGSVPYSATFSFDLNTIEAERRGEIFTYPTPGREVGEARNFLVSLPPGFVGNPNAATRCTQGEFNRVECPLTSIVGMVSILTVPEANFPVFNMVPLDGTAAEFEFTFDNITSYLESGIRTDSDYGINTFIPNIPQKWVLASTLTLWGVPGDPSHNAWRFPTLNSELCLGSRELELQPGGRCNIGPHPALKPFLRLPTSCDTPPAFSITANTWFEEAYAPIRTFLTPGQNGDPSALIGCGQLPFDPTISSKPTTNVADAPTGLKFNLHIPQPEGVKALEGQAKYPIEEEVEGEVRTIGAEPELHEADLKNAVVTLPKGIAVNPASANGLAACSSAQVGLTSAVGASPITTTAAPATCPNASKIGSVEVDTPLLDHPLKGGVYVATPLDNPFGSLLAIYIAVNDPESGVVLKSAGDIKADPQTGQIQASFRHNPQIPFEDFHLSFFEGAHAALRTPQVCGAYGTTTEMTPWSSPEGADALPSDGFEITQSPSGGNCPTDASNLPNAPTFEAGTLSPKAGAYSPFLLHLARQDGSQEIKQIDATLPEGLLGKLAGVGECSEAQIAQATSRNKLGDGALEKASPSCPLNSEVGTVSVGAGAGPDPYYVTGHAYLAGPYKGASLSLAIVTPAVAGPYDLGTVVVRTALYVNPETAQIHAVSDPIPTILQGIPLDARSISLSMNRPNFTLNPTSCAEKSVLGSATSVLGQVASLSQRFQVGECSKLGFKPKLSIHLKGATKRAGNPALRAVVTYPKGAYANIARASVALPHSEFLDNAHIKTICTRVVFAEGAVPGEKCPPGSIYGHARAITPLLDNPLEGPVYLRSSSHKLPDLVAALNGQINVDLDGRIDSVHGGIRNSFELVPDAPVAKFVLSMQGGKKGLLVNSENICSKPQRATVKLDAQNGASYDTKPLVKASCNAKKKSRGGHRRKGSRH